MRRAVRQVLLGGGAPPIIGQLRAAAAAARLSNPHVLGTASSPPTIAAVGTTIPADTTIDRRQDTHTTLWRILGGTRVTVGGLYRVRSATIFTSGGNLGSSNGAQGTFWRQETVFTGIKLAFTVYPTTLPYRFLVNGQYVDLTGTLTNASSGTTAEYITMTFSGSGTRTVAIEGQGNCGLNGAFIDAAGSIAQTPPVIRGILVGDSFVQGTGATALGDGWGPYMADCLGIRDFWASGSGGTGWDVPTNSSTGYRFGDRTADWLPYSPDVMFFHGSYNDRSSTAVNITTECLAALRTTRAAFPKMPMFVFGAFAGASGPSAGILTAESGMQAAVSQFNDRLTRFIPISSDPAGAWISGTGFVGSTTGSGNSDTMTGSDGIHPTNAGHALLGGKAADAVIANLASMH